MSVQPAGTKTTLPLGNGNSGYGPSLDPSVAGADSDIDDNEDNEDTEDVNARTRAKYIKGTKLGEGTYANVYLGHLRTTGAPVAIKKIKVTPDFHGGLSMDAIREVKYLRELHHPNIISLLDVFSSKGQNLNLVLEFLDSDLEMIIKDPNLTLNMGDIKSWIAMSLRGLWWCHKNFVLHRDIKPNNLLLATNGQLKLADFGLARTFSDPYRAMTSNVITRWYRPPELLMGAKSYSTAVDIFSIGLVFAELMGRTPWLPGASDINQLELICTALGMPSEENWPGVKSLPNYTQPAVKEIVKERGKDFFVTAFPAAGEAGCELLRSMLRLDPRQRVSARDGLEARWFKEEPRPTKPEDLPKKGGGVGMEKVGSDLKRKAGELTKGEELRGKKLARKLDFGKA